MADIIYKDIAPGAKENSDPSITDIQPFCQASDIKSGVSPPKTATLEQNYWRLDGTFSIMQNGQAGQWGIWSRSMSGADGSFSNPPMLTLSFPFLVSSIGVTFLFNLHGPDWCNSLNIKWYNNSVLLDSQNFSPDGAKYTCFYEVEGYNKLVVTFHAMSKPYRYLKLNSVEYGYIRTLGPDELRSVNLFQAVSPISDEVEINTLDFVLSSTDPIPFLFQRKQSLDVYQNDVLQGTFYITKSKRQGEGLYSIEAEDAIGLLADSTHMGGMYSGVAASTIIADILGDISYTLDVSLRNISLYGWLPIASRRDNLAQVAFAIGALVDTSGSDCVRIYSQKSNVSVTYEEGEIFDGAQLETADVVTRIELTEHAFRSDSTETKELYKSALNGSATVTFSEPMHSLSIAGGNITNSGANYAVISATGSNVTLSGIPYRHDTRICSMNNPNSGAMDRENVVRVADATLVSVYNSASVLLRLFERYEKRDTITAKMLLGDAMPGDVVSLETKYDGVKTGVVQSIDLNLARKRIGQAVILCQ